MASADEQSSRMCVSCGRSIEMDANVCQHCGHDFRAPAEGPAAPKKKTVIPVIGGALILVAGIMGLALGGILLAIDVEDLDAYGMDVVGVTDMIDDIMTVCGIIVIILSLLVVLGGVLGLLRKSWGFAIVGGVLGLFVFGPFMLGSLFALVGLILVGVSRKEFE